ncbi:MAG: methylenetetrahydrofolate reductase C-terminal domain-containing protein [Planctomycetota bacterium]
MCDRLQAEGIDVAGWAVPSDGGSLCSLSSTVKLLNETHAEAVEHADSFLVLACGEGVHTVIDATNGAPVHPGCDTVFGGEFVGEGDIREHCSLCGECIADATGGLCPITLCAKSLLNGPCGGAQDGKCEVNPERDCGWRLIYEHLQQLGRTDLLYQYREPKNWLKSEGPRTLAVDEDEAAFSYADKETSACAETENRPTEPREREQE